MTITPLVLTHVFASMIGLIAGAVSMFARKGSGWHGAAGTVFFVAMLTMSVSGGYVAAVERPNMMNVTAASLMFYMVSTSWWAAKRRDGKAGAFELIAMLFVLAVGINSFASAGMHGMGRGIYYVFGTLALLFVLADLRLLRRGGAFGPQRITRHLTRMCLALLLATLSFYPGQARLFPAEVRGAHMFIPHIALIVSIFYWRFRLLRRRKAAAERAVGMVEGRLAA